MAETKRKRTRALVLSSSTKSRSTKKTTTAVVSGLSSFILDDFLVKAGFPNEPNNGQASKQKSVIKELDELIRQSLPIFPSSSKTGKVKVALNKTGLSSEVVKNFKNSNPGASHVINLNNKTKIKPLLRATVQAKPMAPPVRVLPPKLLKKSLLADLLSAFKSKTDQKIPAQTPIIFHAENQTVKGFPKPKRLSSLKTALNFCLLALLVMAPIKGFLLYQRFQQTKGQVLGETESAIQGLKGGVNYAGAKNWNQAVEKFSQAENFFGQASLTLEGYNQSFTDLLKTLPLVGSKLSHSADLLKSGELLSAAAADFSALAWQIANQSGDLPLESIKKSTGQITEKINEAIFLLQNINQGVLPEGQRGSFSSLKSSLPQIKNQLEHINSLINFSLGVMGYDAPKRYLIIFQNNGELRPTGGFMGSFALVDVAKGKITNMEVPGGGLYDLKGDFFEKIIAPKPFHILGTDWQIWNANWWPDFAVSAKKIIWFFEHSGWPTPDGVIAVNATLLPEILKLTGNINLPEYDQILTPKNVLLALQHETEFEYDKKENKPKKIIGDLFEILIPKLLQSPPEKYLPFLLTLNENMGKKEIQFFFNNQNEQVQARTLGITGEITPDSGNDYLMVNRANIAGGKTDLVISQQIKHYSVIDKNGDITDTVSITLAHNGNPEDVFERVQNNSFIRAYVPLGSQLLAATGYDTLDSTLFKEIYQGYAEDSDLKSISGEMAIDTQSGTSINNELGKTVFGNWLQLKPGQSKTLTFSYRLPFKLEIKRNFWSKMLNKLGFAPITSQQSYSVKFASQSGVKNSFLESRVLLPKNQTIFFSSQNGSGELEAEKNSSYYASDFTTDLSYGFLIKTD